MTEHASATFTVEGWNEERTVDGDRGAIALAKVDQSLAGDLEGSGFAQWLMCYREDQTADFVGLQRFEGSLGARTGSFVLTSNGTFDGKIAAGEMRIVDGSGTGELAGIEGGGAFSAPHGGNATIDLDYLIA
jgi:hypothetical protein